MLIDTEIFADVGQFDTKYAWGWGEDAEFQLRCRLAGRQALHDPRALCIHDGYERGLERAQAQIQNRYRLLCTYYRIRTLVLIIPSLILFECALTALSVYQGLWRQRFRGAANIARQFADIRKTRRELQALRKVPDRELLDDRSMDTPEYGRKSSWIKGLFALFSGFLRLNWVLVRNWV